MFSSPKYTFILSSLSLFGINTLLSYINPPSIQSILSIRQSDPFLRSKNCIPLNKSKLLLFSGNSNRPLSEEVAKCLGLNLSKSISTHYSDGECNIHLLESVRGKNCYIIQPTSTPVNENLMELLLTIGTMRRANAKSITAVIPYYGYGRSDRKEKKLTPISAADVAKLLEAVGIDRCMCVDLHCGQIQGFFEPNIAVDNLEAVPLMVKYLIKKNLISDYNKLMIVSPDHGGVYRAKAFAQLLMKKTNAKNIGTTMIIKQRPRPNEVSRMDLVGDVRGNDCIIVDDMIDTGTTLCLAAKCLKDNGAENVYCFATHGLFNGMAIEKIQNSVLNKVIVTDTIPPPKTKYSEKIKRISVALLISEAIRRIQNNESLTELYE
jgi:ribose-phosphate pyrophosphokinase